MELVQQDGVVEIRQDGYVLIGLSGDWAYLSIGISEGSYTLHKGKCMIEDHLLERCHLAQAKVANPGVSEGQTDKLNNNLQEETAPHLARPPDFMSFVPLCPFQPFSTLFIQSTFSTTRLAFPTQVGGAQAQVRDTCGASIAVDSLHWYSAWLIRLHAVDHTTHTSESSRCAISAVFTALPQPVSTLPGLTVCLLHAC